MDATTLHEAVAEVCPIVGVSMGRSGDRNTWSFDPAPEATPEQIAAGENVIATLPIELKGRISSSEFVARWTNAEYLKLEQKRAADISGANPKIGNAKTWDILMLDSVIDMNKKKVQALKTDLVTDGILTQARADEIFR
jgi:hypothetical protein